MKDAGRDLLRDLRGTPRAGRMRERIIVMVPREPLQARWCPGGTIVFGGWTIYGSDPVRQLCRLLVQGGQPDGPLQFCDPEGRPVLFVWSLAALASRDEAPAAVAAVPATVVDLFGLRDG